MAEPAEGDEMVKRDFVGATLVAGVHGLRRAKDLGNLSLRQVIIFPKSP